MGCFDQHDGRVARTRHGWSLAAIFAAMISAPGVHPAAAQANRTPVPSNLPLERYERIVPYRNGCNAIVRLGETPPDSRTRWYGACRFGLAHGPGIYRLDWTIDGVNSFATSSVEMSYGRWQGPPKPGGSLKPGAESVTLSRGLEHDSQQWELVEDGLNAELKQPNGKFALDIVARSSRHDDVRHTDEMLWVVKYQCPTYGTLEEILASQSYPLDRAQIAIIAPLCRQAMSRLKAERGSAAIDRSSPFDDANYGYYFLVHTSLDVQPRKGDDYDVNATVSTKTDIQLCPQPTSLAGCEGLWRARQQPFRTKRDALAANYDRLLALDYASREANFRPLEDALRAKIRGYATRPARASQARPQANKTTIRRSKEP